MLANNGECSPLAVPAPFARPSPIRRRHSLSQLGQQRRAAVVGRRWPPLCRGAAAGEALSSSAQGHAHLALDGFRDGIEVVHRAVGGDGEEDGNKPVEGPPNQLDTSSQKECCEPAAAPEVGPKSVDGLPTRATMELFTPAASDPPPPPPTSPPPLRRKGTAVGLLLTRAETVENPCIPMFYFMLGGVLPIGQVRERVWDAIKKFDRFRSILEGDDFVADDDAFRIEDHVRELTARGIWRTVDRAERHGHAATLPREALLRAARQE